MLSPKVACVSAEKDGDTVRNDFSAHFLKIIPPDTNYGEAWESICHDLLVAEHPGASIQRMNPPDNGIDLFRRDNAVAYQCKADERGAFGSLSATESIASLQTAHAHRSAFAWRSYVLCTNANYTGAAAEKIQDAASELGLEKGEIDFHGPERWDDLCTKHYGVVARRLRYRVETSEEHVISALKTAGYYDQYVHQYAEKIRSSGFRVVVTNNRTPVELEIPFSPDLTVENCLDVTQALLGISLERTAYPELGTSAGPSISLTIDGRAQGFSQTIKDLSLEPGQPLQLWVTIRWKDHKEDSSSQAQTTHLERYHSYSRVPIPRPVMTQDQRRDETLRKSEQGVQNMIWDGVRRLLSANQAL